MKIDLYILPAGFQILDTALTLLVTAVAYKFDCFKRLSCYDYRNFAILILLCTFAALVVVFYRYWDLRWRARIVPPEEVHDDLDQELKGRKAQKIGRLKTHKARKLLFLASFTFFNLLTVAIGSIPVIVSQTVLHNNPAPSIETWRSIQWSTVALEALNIVIFFHISTTLFLKSHLRFDLGQWFSHTAFLVKELFWFLDALGQALYLDDVKNLPDMVWYKNVMIVVFCLQGLLVICLISKWFGFDKMENVLTRIETCIQEFYFQAKIEGQPYQPESLLMIERPCVGEKIRNCIGNKKVKEPDANAQDEQAEDLNQEQQAGGPNHGGQERIPEQDDQEQVPSQDEQVEVPNLDPPNEPELPAEPSASCDVSERIGARNLIIQPGDLVSSNHEEGQVSDEGRDLNVPYVNATDDSYKVRDIIDGHFEGTDDTTLTVDNGIGAGIVYARNQAVGVHNAINQGVEGAEILWGLNKRANSLGQTGAQQSDSGLGNNTEGRNLVETSHVEGRGGSSEGLEHDRDQVNGVTVPLLTGRLSISSKESERRVSN